MWDFTAPLWDSVFRWATILTLVFGGIGIFSAFVSAWVGYEITDATQRDADKRIKESQARSDEARADAARANEAAAKANQRAAQLTKENAILEADNLALQTSLRPRRLSFVGWIEDPKKISAITGDLQKYSGTNAFIQVVPDFEAQLFANDIANELARDGWHVQFVTTAQSHMNELNFPEGVTLFTLSDGKTVTQAGTALWSALTEADILMSGTGTSGAPIIHKILNGREPGCPWLHPPVTSVFIRIGLKPFTQQFVEIQRRQLERQDNQIDRALLDAYDAGKKVLMAVPGHPAIEVKPGPEGGWIAVNPEEAALVPKRTSPTLMLPGGVMLRSSPPPDRAAPNER